MNHFNLVNSNIIQSIIIIYIIFFMLLSYNLNDYNHLYVMYRLLMSGIYDNF